MGKRKLLGTTFYQCDWTGFPLRQAYCYMPTWVEKEQGKTKMLKRGSYCNWESVVAHVQHLLAAKQMTEETATQVYEHIVGICGYLPAAAPCYTELAHTKGSMHETEFHAMCCKGPKTLNAVRLTPNGAEAVEISVEDWKACLGTTSYTGPVASFHSMRKKGAAYDLTVFYYPHKEAPYNHLASNMFKMQLYGNVLLVNQSREQCFMPRERYVGFTLANFEETQSKKRKRAESQSMSVEEYGQVKKAMQADLDKFEKTVAKDAAEPRALSLGTSRVSLAESLRIQGRTP